MDTMTAEIVWRFEPDPVIFSQIWGDADRLANGNTLVTFGLRVTDEDRESHIIEVDADAAVLWDLVFPPRWGVYRAERFPALTSQVRSVDTP